MTTYLDKSSRQGITASAHYDVAVVGAGPYGLSTAAHLRSRGLEVGVFGKSLQFWRDNMPEGMLLRSYWWASNLSDPEHKYNMAQYFRLQGQDAPNLLPIETFIDYSLWFQRSAVPEVDETYVSRIEDQSDYFMLVLEDGRTVYCGSLVMAPGLKYYVYSPPEYQHLAEELMSHSFFYNSFRRFAGKRVAVIGSGQGALESAALLHEQGAQVEVIARSPIHWLVEGTPLEKRPLLEKLKRPKAATALGWVHWGLENFPYFFHQLPRATKDEQIRKRFGPAGASWLRPRLVGMVPLHEGVVIEKLSEADNGVELSLSNNKVLTVDHILLGTGYRVDISKLPMLSKELLTHIQTYQNAPILNNCFECSVPRLYFTGLSSVSSFGPFYRFVAGTDATARRIAATVAGRTKQLR
jgi:cation diffusion facilitator CzcD-associated flavoprotein CzcO